MSSDVRYDRQGEGWNALPHLLEAVLDPNWNGAVRWTVQCPYEGSGRPCALLEECTEHERPQEPYGMMSAASFDDPEVKQRWALWRKAEDAWAEEHPDDAYHLGDRCWAEYMVAQGECEPEYFLAEMPPGQVIEGRMRVLVGRSGYLDEAEPVFRLWDENRENGESR